MKNFGFIICRHVRCEKTNKYWNQCVKLIRTLYPFKQIIIIDDNSNQEFVKADFDYNNITIIQSEYPGRGEILPFIYLLKYKWFKNACFIHDSVFIHKRVPFETFNVPVLPIWHHTYDKENLDNLIRLASALNNNSILIEKLRGSTINILGLKDPDKFNFNLVFGCQTYINLSFLELIQNKYNITNLVNVVHNRTDRCGMERIFGLLFTLEYPNLNKINSLFGNIIRKNHSFNYHYEDYENDLKEKKIIYPFVKVWSGR